MATAARRPHMSLAEFLDWDDGTDTLYELVDGRIVAMAPPNDAHGTIVINLGAELKQVVQPPCRVVANAGIVLPDRDDRYYIADLVVTCDQAADERRFLPAPRVIVEVLSPSTTAHDRGLKGEDYRQLPSVQEILFVACDRRRVVLLRREAEQWVIKDFIGDASIRLESLDATVPLAAVYSDVVISEPSARRRRRKSAPRSSRKSS